MSRGPLPDPNRRRRNAPTIPTTNLPASGCQEPTPDVPAWVDLGEAGIAWWEWAWHTPQACGWDDGQIVTVARRASVEDDLRIVNNVDNLDFSDIIDAEEQAAVKRAVGYLAGLCIGRDKLIKLANDLDDKLGLTPKGLAALRWRVVADPKQAKPKPETAGSVTSLDDRRARLTADA